MGKCYRYMKRRAQDILSCLKRIDSFTNGQAFVQDWDKEQMVWIRIQIRPDDGPYQGGMFDFEFSLYGTYPFEPPSVLCTTVIFHPNIDPDSPEGNVCLSLFDEWADDGSFGLEDAIQGLLFLMHHPNLDDPLSPYFNSDLSEEEFRSIVQKSMRGGRVADIGLSFKCVMVTHDDKIENDITCTCMCKMKEKTQNIANIEEDKEEGKKKEEEEEEDEKEEEEEEEEGEEEVKSVEFYEELHESIIQTIEEKIPNIPEDKEDDEVEDDEEEDDEEEEEEYDPIVLDNPAEKTRCSRVIQCFTLADPITDLCISLSALIIYSQVKHAFRYFFSKPEPEVICVYVCRDI